MEMIENEHGDVIREIDVVHDNDILCIVPRNVDVKFREKYGKTITYNVRYTTRVYDRGDSCRHCDTTCTHISNRRLVSEITGSVLV